jgi:hypothetical protein
LYTQFKEKSFIAGLGTNGSNTLPCEKVFCYSGGTEAGIIPYGSQNIGTSRIRGAPFLKVKTQHIKYEADAHQLGFSKTYDDSFNPQSAFAAILTCHKRMALFYCGC